MVFGEGGGRGADGEVIGVGPLRETMVEVRIERASTGRAGTQAGHTHPHTQATSSHPSPQVT